MRISFTAKLGSFVGDRIVYDTSIVVRKFGALNGKIIEEEYAKNLMSLVLVPWNKLIEYDPKPNYIVRTPENVAVCVKRYDDSVKDLLELNPHLEPTMPPRPLRYKAYADNSSSLTQFPIVFYSIDNSPITKFIIDKHECANLDEYGIISGWGTATYVVHSQDLFDVKEAIVPGANLKFECDFVASKLSLYVSISAGDAIEVTSGNWSTVITGPISEGGLEGVTEPTLELTLGEPSNNILVHALQSNRCPVVIDKALLTTE